MDEDNAVRRVEFYNLGEDRTSLVILLDSNAHASLDRAKSGGDFSLYNPSVADLKKLISGLKAALIGEFTNGS